MIPPYYKPLINSLIGTTRSNKTHWSRTSSPDQFKLMLEKGMIVISCKRDILSQYIKIEIYDELGKIVDSISENEKYSFHEYSILLDLYNTIKEQKDSITQRKINDLMSEIMSGNDIGKEE